MDAISSVFGKNVFDDDVMRERLPKDVYKKLKETISDGRELDLSVANAVAHAMKEWALEHGATHYTHWFQPMTGITAEKHDSFISPTGDGKVIMTFSGKELIKGEPDASSFPSGGLRATFEARGYTAWDCTSPAFIKEEKAGNILCIPTAFCSYTGEALDKKTPLLKSGEALSREAVRIVRLFGHDDVKKVTTSVGPEQEYFIIDRDKYLKREDLIFTGRTLFGALPPKGQELEDHYFGNIPERVGAFMKDLNVELWKLGVLAKTQHNEVAPAQHEMAPIFGSTNVATDHNQLTMEMMKTVARRHNLECLLHEKPFAGVNGSGKHNNWSIGTDTGINLLDPGANPHENMQFLLVLASIVKAVDEHAVLLRLAASNPGNDHRLGAHEAPPAIVSIFLGDQLEDVVNQIISKGEAKSSIHGEKMDTGVTTLPIFSKDATDRNRTSPFAFTGNKFEFRMVASSVSIACANIMLNTIVADAFKEAADILEKSKDFNKDCFEYIKKTLTEHSRVIFNGNGYSKEWVEEAKKRGLPNVKTFVEAISSLTDPKTVKMCEAHKVFTKQELESRAEIQYDTYKKTIHIEAKTMIDMTDKLYIPAVVEFEKELSDSILKIKEVDEAIDISVQKDLLINVSKLLKDVSLEVKDLKDVVDKADLIDKAMDSAIFYKDEVVPKMALLRKSVDALEQIVDKKYWPVPSYGDLLFEV